MTDLDENPFSTTDPIFDEKSILKKDELPEKIFHRDNEIQQYRIALEDILTGHDPNNVFVYGPTGVGKTAVTRWIQAMLEEKAVEADVPLEIVGPVNCRNYRSAYALATALVNKFRDPDNELSNSGYSTDKVFDYLYEEIEAAGGNVVIVLDEIDNIPPDARNDFLYELPRAEMHEMTPIEDAAIGLIGISNDLKFVDVLEPKVKSTLGEREIKFGPYDADELSDILEYYAEQAFKPGVLSEDVVLLAAAFSAQERGDVRQGKRILQKAGELAKMDDSSLVTEAHTRAATETIETNEILDYFNSDLTSHQSLVYLAVTLAAIEPDQDASTKRVYKLYQSIAESMLQDAKSERKMYEFLDQLSMQGLVRSTEENRGRKGGRRYVYDVTDDPQDIISAVQQSSYEEALPGNVDEILKYHVQDEASEFTAPDQSNKKQKQLWNFT